MVWIRETVKKLHDNWTTDIIPLFKLWIPVDFVCFTLPMWLRLPIRHIFSLIWTIYYSFMRGE